MATAGGQFRFCETCKQIYEPEMQFCPRDGARLEARADILAGRFILGRELGAGSMGVVYEAEQPAMDRKVAIKLLHPERTRDPQLVQRFEREALAAGKIDHPNVVTIYESGRAGDGQIYIAMEYLEGENLAQRLAREQRLPPEQALALFLPAVKGLAAAHHKGVVHRDIKPENIFIARKHSGEGPEEQVKILDFGIAKVQAGRAPAVGTLDGTILGTLLYMAPEQIHGRPAGPAADVYALGLILVEMLAGRLPWGGGDDLAGSSYLLRLARPPLPLQALCPSIAFPPAVQQLLDEVLAIDPGRRPAHAGELLQRVKQVLRDAPPPWPGAVGPSLLAPAQGRAAAVGAVRTGAGEDNDLTDVNLSVSGLKPALVEDGTLPGTERVEAVTVPPGPGPGGPVPGGPVPDGKGAGPGPRRWPLGVIAGIAVLTLCMLLVALLSRGPAGPGPVPPRDMAVVEVRPDLSPIGPVREPEHAEPRPRKIPMEKPPQATVQILFVPRLPASVRIECTGARPIQCGSRDGCRITVPVNWKCSASSGSTIYLPAIYRSTDYRKSARIVVELRPRPLL